MSEPDREQWKRELQTVLESLGEEPSSDQEVVERLRRTIAKRFLIFGRFEFPAHPTSDSERECLEAEAWQLAYALQLEIARVPWPVVPDAEGRLAPRERALLWSHLVLAEEPLREIDLEALPPLDDDSREPVLRALWRYATRSDVEDLAPSHREALDKAHAGRLGLVPLVIEEATALAEREESIDPLLSLGSLFFLLVDSSEIRRQGIFRLWKHRLVAPAEALYDPSQLGQAPKILDYYFGGPVFEPIELASAPGREAEDAEEPRRQAEEGDTGEVTIR